MLILKTTPFKLFCFHFFCSPAFVGRRAVQGARFNKELPSTAWRNQQRDKSLGLPGMWETICFAVSCGLVPNYELFLTLNDLLSNSRPTQPFQSEQDRGLRTNRPFALNEDQLDTFSPTNERSSGWQSHHDAQPFFYNRFMLPTYLPQQRHRIIEGRSSNNDGHDVFQLIHFAPLFTVWLSLCLSNQTMWLGNRSKCRWPCLNASLFISLSVCRVWCCSFYALSNHQSDNIHPVVVTIQPWTGELIRKPIQSFKRWWWWCWFYYNAYGWSCPRPTTTTEGWWWWWWWLEIDRKLSARVLTGEIIPFAKFFIIKIQPSALAAVAANNERRLLPKNWINDRAGLGWNGWAIPVYQLVLFLHHDYSGLLCRRKADKFCH